MNNEISSARLAAYALPWLPVMAVNLAITSLVAGHYSSDLGVPLFAVSVVMLGVFLSTAWPTLFGFEPSAVSNTPAAEFQVAVSYVWITCFFLALAAPMFRFFPLTRERHAELRAAIDAKAIAATRI